MTKDEIAEAFRSDPARYFYGYGSTDLVTFPDEEEVEDPGCRDERRYYRVPDIYARVDGVSVGYIHSLTIEGDTAWVKHRFSIEHDFLKRGLATAMAHALRDILVARYGVKHIEFHERNEPRFDAFFVGKLNAERRKNQYGFPYWVWHIQ